MFEPSATPRLFGTPIGADFGATLLEGLEARLAGAPPEAWGRVTLLVNTTRMKRQLLDQFAAGPARLMPRVHLVTDLAGGLHLTGLKPAVSSLQLRLQLRQAVARLIDLQPDIAPKSAAFDLANSLAALLEEMDDEGVDPATLGDLDVGDHSAHWARSLSVISLLSGQDSDIFRTQAAFNRDALSALLSLWDAAPPQTPIIVAGSTGSRGTTRLLMEAVARLPQGAVVLPGVDRDTPQEVWRNLTASCDNPDRAPEEDHPQFRFAALAKRLGVAPDDIAPWTDTKPDTHSRNRLVSLSLRPAPVTDQWLSDGPKLVEELPDATDGLSLITARTPRHEAAAIAFAIREAVEANKTTALITPDRTLARQVTAALSRWGIVPDDSAGMPLHQSPPGRFLIETAALFGRPLDLAVALSLLKHPLTASNAGMRGPHLLNVGRFETWARRKGVPRVDAAVLQDWLGSWSATDEAKDWVGWLGSVLENLPNTGGEPLEARLERHIDLAEAIAAGPDSSGSGQLWADKPGEAAGAAVDELRMAAPFGGAVDNVQYLGIIRSVLAGGEVREAPIAHPLVSIWGTIEARTRTVDLSILAGLNEGTWPAALPHDPWMNRAMRRDAGMLLPERRVGLAAHDYQQAMGAREVIFSRSAQSADTETVPSRWLNRLTNLLSGLGEIGETCLKEMRARGDRLVAISSVLAVHSENPISALPAPRPAPAPPAEARPKGLFVTAVSTLIRDPYAVYAKNVLELRRLGPRAPQPDAAMRGTVLHAVMEQCLKDGFDFTGPSEWTAEAFMEVAAEVVATHVPWPATRRLWLGRLASSAPALVRVEAALQASGMPIIVEEIGSVQLRGVDFRVSAKPDRIDRLEAGGCAVLDYKTSTKPPSEKEVEAFDKQLLLEAAIAEAGGFKQLGAKRAARVGYISIGNPANSRDEPLEIEGVWRPDAMLQNLAALIRTYEDPSKGYTARRAPQFLIYASDYDHLSRFGEWDVTAAPETILVGQ
ncbi:double-strand break repair protein AddB [Vannielia litorea]|uniref:double-strand break repair protein AddB n=1 Tax=Vannielia litorea TaxID=1217970 RepID=UPI001C9830AD|nr:double-strand break repair protein AddB [Vannielia litorea]MBY6049322.1 double-strand break repair protein AddB [Vannielia litorea]MBY6076736.1 double-strand break repair protein AddB [Vannielia litorea]